MPRAPDSKERNNLDHFFLSAFTEGDVSEEANVKFFTFRGNDPKF